MSHDCQCSKQGAPEVTEGLTAWFTHCHRRCDSLWAAVESAVDSTDSSSLSHATGAFLSAVRAHLEMEENGLFPRLQVGMGGGCGGPVPVMISEHGQMKLMLDAIEVAARDNNGDRVLELGDTLLMMTQQHNIKEEQILYPMAERMLGSEWGEMHHKLTTTGCLV